MDLRQLIGMGRDTYTKLKHHNTGGNMKQIAFLLTFENLEPNTCQFFKCK